MHAAARRANESRWTVLDHKPDGAKGVCPESWLCVDCGFNTAPGMAGRKQLDIALALYGVSKSRYDHNTEVYTLRDEVWRKLGIEPMGGCLCVGCVEKRLGRRLRPRDFGDHVFNEMPGTPRLATGAESATPNHSVL
jgi:hypothetical protein